MNSADNPRAPATRNRRFTDAQVAHIRRWAKENVPYKEMARRLGFEYAHDGGPPGCLRPNVLSEVVYNHNYYDPFYAPPNRFVPVRGAPISSKLEKRLPAEQCPFVCKVCGMAYPQGRADIPFASQAEADKCCAGVKPGERIVNTGCAYSQKPKYGRSYGGDREEIYVPEVRNDALPAMR